MKRPILVLAAVAAVLAYWRFRSPDVKRAAVGHAPTAPQTNPTPSFVSAPVRVQVIGTVRSPGILQLEPPSLAEALKRATPTPLSDLKKVHVRHRNSDAGVPATVIDASGLLESTTADVPLQEGDQVYVPEKIL